MAMIHMAAHTLRSLASAWYFHVSVFVYSIQALGLREYCFLLTGARQFWSWLDIFHPVNDQQ